MCVCVQRQCIVTPLPLYPVKRLELLRIDAVNKLTFMITALHRVDAIDLNPVDLVTATMEVQTPGRWLVSCNTLSHIKGNKVNNNNNNNVKEFTKVTGTENEFVFSIKK